MNLINSCNLTGLTSKTPWSKDTYYQQYQKSFKDGEYNLKEPVWIPTGQVIRTYFSGGMSFDTQAISSAVTLRILPANPAKDITKVVSSVIGNPFIHAALNSYGEIIVDKIIPSASIQQRQKNGLFSTQRAADPVISTDKIVSSSIEEMMETMQAGYTRLNEQKKTGRTVVYDYKGNEEYYFDIIYRENRDKEYFKEQFNSMGIDEKYKDIIFKMIDSIKELSLKIYMYNSVFGPGLGFVQDDFLALPQEYNDNPVVLFSALGRSYKDRGITLKFNGKTAGMFYKLGLYELFRKLNWLKPRLIMQFKQQKIAIVLSDEAAAIALKGSEYNGAFFAALRRQIFGDSDTKMIACIAQREAKRKQYLEKNTRAEEIKQLEEEIEKIEADSEITDKIRQLTQSFDFGYVLEQVSILIASLQSTQMRLADLFERIEELEHELCFLCLENRLNRETGKLNSKLNYFRPSQSRSIRKNIQRLRGELKKNEEYKQKIYHLDHKKIYSKLGDNNEWYSTLEGVDRNWGLINNFIANDMTAKLAAEFINLSVNARQADYLQAAYFVEQFNKLLGYENQYKKFLE